MAVTAEWENEEKTIILYAFSGEWTWEEFDVVAHDVGAMLDSVDHKVDFTGSNGLC